MPEPDNIMLIQVGLGEDDLALEWLARSLEDRSGLLWQMPVEPRFARIRNEPRFRELLERHGLQS